MDLSTDTCRKWSTLIGVFLLVFPNGISFIWGNLAVYTNSYFYNRLNIVSGLYVPWAYTIKMSATELAIILSAILSKLVPKRVILAVSVMLTFVSLFGCYFALQKSIIAFNVLFGFVYGFSMGPIIVIGMKYVVDHTENRTSFYLVMIKTGQIFGAILANEFTTLYINPYNLEPKQEVGPSKLFGQADITDRVQYIFLYMAGGFGLIQIVGLLLLRDKNTNCTNASTILSLQEDKNHGSYGTNEDRNKSCFIMSSALVNEESDNATSAQSVATKENDVETSFHPNSVEGIGVTTCSHPMPENGNARPMSMKREEKTKNTSTTLSKSNVIQSDVENELTPKQMLRTSTFYSLFFTFMAFAFNFTVANIFYKTYGLLWIPDDLLLSSIGNVSVVLCIFTVIVWGILVDKYNVKVCLIALHSIASILCFFYYFTPMVSTSLYYVTCVALASIVTPGHAIYNAATVKYFGKTHFTANSSVFYIAPAFMNLVTSPILDAVLLHCGWFYVFCLSGIFSLSAFICVVFTL